MTDQAPGRLDGFNDADETLRTLTHPTDGWYRRRNGAIGHYSIWHDMMAARDCSIASARFTFLESLGLISSSCKPHSALTQPTIHFDIYTPPRRFHPKPLPRHADHRGRMAVCGPGSRGAAGDHRHLRADIMLA
jgi:hypothetical protein